MLACHFVYAQKKSRAFPNFPKLAIAKHCYVRLPYANFYPNWTVSVDVLIERHSNL
jgi:hypothetical protein